ncbi:hypothetical protein NL493_29485, partial [Klebsiella pneumoniae]|nr:hypothetical protein [Klebsiella pneumoniae]
MASTKSQTSTTHSRWAASIAPGTLGSTPGLQRVKQGFSFRPASSEADKTSVAEFKGTVSVLF